MEAGDKCTLKNLEKHSACFLTRAPHADFGPSIDVQEMDPEAETKERTKTEKKSQVFCFPLIAVWDFKRRVFLLVAEAVFPSATHPPALLHAANSRHGAGPRHTPAYFHQPIL